MASRKLTTQAIWFVALFLPATFLLSQTAQAQDSSQPQTIAEQSNYLATSLSSEVEDFLAECADQADHITLLPFGKSLEGRPMTAAIVANPPFDPDQHDERLRILLLGNIHSGECAGKEALLAMLRDLINQPNHPWLKESVIVIAPNYGADANDRVGPNHRPGQLGPERGMGRRENSQQLDLNRDFMKLDSPEARNLIGLIDRLNPHMFIDCHTTNGSRHRYCLTYDIPHNPTTSVAIEQFQRQVMMPTVTSELAKRGKDTFYYGNLNRSGDSWTTYGSEPRYSTEYVGLRGRLAILSEAYAYISYRERIEATYEFVGECVEFVNENADDVRELLGKAEGQFVEAVQRQREADRELLLSQAVEIAAYDDPFTILTYQGDQPADLEVKFFGKYEPTKSRQIPFAYLLPQSNAWQADRLRMHGIQVESLSEDTEFKVQINQCETFSKAERAFQNHNMATYAGTIRQETITVPAGTYVIRMAQPLGRLAAYLLDPESNDGLTTWNFFDDQIAVGKDHPVMAITSPVQFDSTALSEIAAQEKLTLESIYSPDNKVNFDSSPAGQIQWLDGENRYKRTWTGRPVIVDAPTGAMTPDRQGMNERRLSGIANRIRMDQGWEDSESEEAEDITLDDLLSRPGSDQFAIAIENQLVVFDTRDESSQVVPESIGAELPTFSDNGRWLTFVRENDLYLYDCESKETQTIAASEHEQVFNGKLDWVYQEEIYGRGQFQAYWWSPDSRWVAFLQLDDRNVPAFTVTDHIPTPGKQEVTAYPKAGATNPNVKIGLYDTDTGDLQWLPLQFVNPDLHEENKPELLVSRVTWSEANVLYYQVQDREQTWLDLWKHSTSDNESSKLFRDQTPAWIETPGDPEFLPDGSFLWISPRSGYFQIYRYSSDGEPMRNVTEGEWEVRGIEAISSDGQTVFFSGNLDSAIETHCYAVSVDGGMPQRLTELGASHSVDFADSADFFFDRHSSINRPPSIDLRDAEGTLIRILDPNYSDRWNYVDVAAPEFMTISNADDQPMDAVMIKPSDFDPSKKYPVLVYVYSGPQAPVVQNSWRGSTYLWHQMLAQQGYIIWMCDNRSSSYRGIGQAWPIHGNLGENELKDIESGLDWLAQQPYIDSDRIGIWGWSYGGYMTSYALTHSDRFRVGLSGAPVTDWHNYDSIYTERYMRTPQSNPEGYKSSSVVEAASELNGSLLLIHGTMDDNVHMSNSVQLIYALQQAGKTFELMMYPKSRHGVRDPDLNYHLRRLMTRFIHEQL